MATVSQPQTGKKIHCWPFQGRLLRYVLLCLLPCLAVIGLLFVILGLAS